MDWFNIPYFGISGNCSLHHNYTCIICGSNFGYNGVFSKKEIVIRLKKCLIIGTFNVLAKSQTSSHQDHE